MGIVTQCATVFQRIGIAANERAPILPGAHLRYDFNPLSMLGNNQMFMLNTKKSNVEISVDMACHVPTNFLSYSLRHGILSTSR